MIIHKIEWFFYSHSFQLYWQYLYSMLFKKNNGACCGKIWDLGNYNSQGILFALKNFFTQVKQRAKFSFHICSIYSLTKMFCVINSIVRWYFWHFYFWLQYCIFCWSTRYLLPHLVVNIFDMLKRTIIGKAVI